MVTPKPIAIFFTLLVSGLSLGCTDSGEDFNHAGLYGSWEMVDFHEDHQLNQVRSLVLNREGGSKLIVHTVCNDVMLSMCAPSPVYSRVTT